MTEPRTEFQILMDGVREKCMLKNIASGTGFSMAHVCDVHKGNRLPSVAFADAMANYTMSGVWGLSDHIAKWHRAGARAHGWLV